MTIWPSPLMTPPLARDEWETSDSIRFFFSQIFPKFSGATEPKNSGLVLVPPIWEMMSCLVLSRLILNELRNADLYFRQKMWTKTNLEFLNNVDLIELADVWLVKVWKKVWLWLLCLGHLTFSPAFFKNKKSFYSLNILLNRFSVLDDLIPLSWLNYNNDKFEIHIKKLLLSIWSDNGITCL